MAREKIDLRDELNAYKVDFNLLQKIPCSKEENKEYAALLENGGTLPKDVFPYVYNDGEESKTEFFTLYKSDLTDAEIAEYLTYKKLAMIKTIKNCVLFFTILTIIGMAAAFILTLSAA